MENGLWLSVILHNMFHCNSLCISYFFFIFNSFSHWAALLLLLLLVGDLDSLTELEIFYVHEPMLAGMVYCSLSGHVILASSQRNMRCCLQCLTSYIFNIANAHGKSLWPNLFRGESVCFWAVLNKQRLQNMHVIYQMSDTPHHPHQTCSQSWRPAVLADPGVPLMTSQMTSSLDLRHERHHHRQQWSSILWFWKTKKTFPSIQVGSDLSNSQSDSLKLIQFS